MNVCIIVHVVMKVIILVLSSHLLLTLSHGQKLEPVPTIPHTVGQLPQVPSWICTGTQDEHNGGLRRRLIIDVIKTNDRGSDVLLPHPTHHKVSDGSVDTVHSEASQQQQLLEIAEAF